MKNFILDSIITATLILGYQVMAEKKGPCLDKPIPAEIVDRLRK